MAALDFPSSPALNQLFAAGNGVTYKWDGDHWVTVSTSSSWLPLTGGTLTGALIIDTPTSSSNIIVGSFADDPSYNAISLNGDATGAGLAGLLGGGASGDLYIAVPTGHAMTFRVGGVDRAIMNNTVFQMNNGAVIASGGDILSYRYGANATPIIRATANSDDAYAPPFLSMWRANASNGGAPGGSTLGAVRFEGLGSDAGYAYWGGFSGDMIGANAVNGGKSDIQVWANLGGNAQPMMRWSGANQNIAAYYAMVGITPSLSAVGTEVVTAAWVKGQLPIPTFDSDNTLRSDGTWSGANGNSIMPITQGVQVFSRAFTVVDATRPIEVDITLQLGNGGTPVTAGGGLFIDGATNAVAQSIATFAAGFMNSPVRVYWQGTLAAGAHTFTVRFGGNAANAWLNGNNGVAMGGGVLKSTMTIREVR